MAEDCSVKTENAALGYRTAGVLIKNGKILLQRERNGDEYAVPGGHVKLGERSDDALKREFFEETGAEISCDRLAFVEESFFEYGNRMNHVLCLYYFVSTSTDIPHLSCQKDNENIVFEWFDIEKLPAITVYPTCLYEKLTDIKPYPEHFIS